MACDDSKPSNETDQPIYIHQGADFNLAFTYTGPDGSTPIDVTGYTFSMVLAEKKPGGAAAATWTSADGDFMIVDASAGRYNLSIPAAETSTMSAGTYWFDHNANSGGSVASMAQGIIIVDPKA